MAAPIKKKVPAPEKMTIKKMPATLNKTKLMVVDSGEGWLKMRKKRMGH